MFLNVIKIMFFHFLSGVRLAQWKIGVPKLAFIEGDDGPAKRRRLVFGRRLTHTRQRRLATFALLFLSYATGWPSVLFFWVKSLLYLM